MVGDSTALTLDIGLNEYGHRDYGVDPFNGGILGCGVTDGAEYQEKGVDAPMAVQCRGAPSRRSGRRCGERTSPRTARTL